MTYLGFVYYGIWYDLCDLPLDDIHYKSVMLSWLCGLNMEVVLIYRFVLMIDILEMWCKLDGGLIWLWGVIPCAFVIQKIHILQVWFLWWCGSPILLHCRFMIPNLMVILWTCSLEVHVGMCFMVLSIHVALISGEGIQYGITFGSPVGWYWYLVLVWQVST